MRGTSMPKSNFIATAYSHEEDVQLSIQLNRWLLKPFGAWPKSVKLSWTKKFAYVLINIVCTGLIGFLFVPTAVYVALEVEGMYNALRLLGPLSFCLMSIVKYSSLIYRESDIRIGLEYIENDWINTRHYGDRTIMIRNAKFGRRLVTICTFFSYGGAAFYYLALPFINGKITEPNINLTYRPLMYPVARAIVDTRYSPVSEIFLWLQCLTGFVAHGITAGVCSLAAAFAIHAYSRLEVLMQWIEHLVDGRKDLYNSVNERLAIIIEEHVRILRFISLVEKILHEISLVEIVECTLNMCFLGYYVIMEWGLGDFATKVTYIILLSSFIFNIFIFCYIGELVAEQCKKVSETSYMIEWHRLPGTTALAVILMIAMSNSSVRLTAGNIIKLSICSFGDVIKTSIAYLNMLRTLTS
ncbi:uncharacterized protein LOC109860675 [Pseudomyrmex gracilis]|uniref:uncharacterized protein LOC109860675 n=1 Tax=Pseudomyrmex gracilis TaxID=219809 RepID=UPI00099557B8|nr:uncharacterized protein LOC109860675 [Pseudomyrmex gracilis]